MHITGIPAGATDSDVIALADQTVLLKALGAGDQDHPSNYVYEYADLGVGKIVQ